jgi:hypothetical protein
LPVSFSDASASLQVAEEMENKLSQAFEQWYPTAVNLIQDIEGLRLELDDALED